MQLTFRQPSRQTRVRYLTPKTLGAELAKSSGNVFWDDGAPPLGAAPQGVRLLPAGERAKTWDALGAVLADLADRRHERSQPVVVVGGGAILDVGALAASLYRRGTPLILVPTTLLGMVDAAVGGKTAVDFTRGESLLKNFAGSFYPANEVWIVPEFLASLSERERMSGAGEVWKSLWIAGKKFSTEPLLRYVRTGQVTPGLRTLIRACLALKISVVKRDPLDERRVREVLNFGHTVGHVLEGAAGGALSHGEAVLWGMAVEARLPGKAGEKMQREVERVITALGLSLPEVFRSLDEAAIRSLLRADKKIKNGVIEMTLLTAPGRAKRVSLEPAQLSAAIKTFPEVFLRV